MTDKPPPGSADWIKGGRAYALARLATGAILIVWFSLVVLILADDYSADLNNLVLAIVGALGVLGGAAQVPNVIENLPGRRAE